MYKNYLKKFVHWKLIIAYLMVTLGLTVVLTTTLGAAHISPVVVLKILLSRLPLINHLIIPSWSIGEVTIILQIRLPRIILGVLVGAALAVAGTTM
ncbi:MAG: iron chelate uptake ABC transporter family permease subunit, partial [bacterium]